jgi:hypothetical protein
LVEESWRLLACAGCDDVTLEKTSSVVLDGEELTDVEFYPERRKTHHRAKLYRNLPLRLSRIYAETISAHNNELHILTAAGLRALLEGICYYKGIKGNNLSEKIDALGTYLPKNIVESLHTFRFLGNLALHQLEQPKKDDLSLAIEVIEDLLNYFYELKYKASRLRKPMDTKKKGT